MRAALLAPSEVEWDQVVRRLGGDVYHSTAYVMHWAAHVGGTARALHVYDTHGELFLPLIFRQLRVQDASPSVHADGAYGYSSPLVLGELGERHAEAARQALRGAGAISLFVRNGFHCQDLGALRWPGLTVRAHGPAVFVRTGRPLASVMDDVRPRLRSQVRQLEAKGFVSRWEGCEALAEFALAYTQTMERVGATDAYFFSREYFESLAEALGAQLRVLVVRASDGTFASGMIIFVSAEVVTYHLGATSPERFADGPSKLAYHELLRWAQETERATVVLGGGVGAREDGLYQLKRGWSQEQFIFQTATAVLDDAVFWKYSPVPEARCDEVLQGHFPPFALEQR